MPQLQSRGVGGWSFGAASSGGSSPLGRPENIVHQTMKMKIKSAPSASSNNKVMR
jgi:hypothetical protein